MNKKLAALALAVCMAAAALPVSAQETPFTDVPEGWAKAEVYAAREAGLMQGVSAGVFGFGSSILRRDYVIILSRMFGWTLETPERPSFTDLPADSPYYPYVETARARGVLDAGGPFEPGRPITRGEMAVMLVRALGYATLAGQVAPYGHGFSDVPAELDGYITVAVDIGMTTGMGDGLFAPQQTATREQAAAMMVRVYRRMTARTDWYHGFYAFSSYAQRELIRDMDAVSLGWSSLCLDGSGIWLNTGRTGGNSWSIPAAYESLTGYLDSVGRPAHLDVYMDMTATLAEGGASQPALRALLASEDYRAQAVSAIMAEATRPYESIGKSPYSGVTIDFEGLRASDREGFSAFLARLSQALKAQGLGLYVAVQPAVFGETYFDGFDFRAIGQVADKVILMAHDYFARNLSDLVGTTAHMRTPPTPLHKVYYALRAITDGRTGVSDPGKVALAISFSTVGWELDPLGRVASGMLYQPTTATLTERLGQADAVAGWSEAYRNPYVAYSTGGKSYHVWYEDARSVGEKVALARLFGVTGVSVWRLGLVPDTAGIYDLTGLLAAR